MYCGARVRFYSYRGVTPQHVFIWVYQLKKFLQELGTEIPTERLGYVVESQRHLILGSQTSSPGADHIYKPPSRCHRWSLTNTLVLINYWWSFTFADMVQRAERLPTLEAFQL